MHWRKRYRRGPFYPDEVIGVLFGMLVCAVSVVGLLITIRHIMGGPQ